VLAHVSAVNVQRYLVRLVGKCIKHGDLPATNIQSAAVKPGGSRMIYSV
jgi:hypothetical protein